MDSRNNFLKDFVNWIAGIDDEYLIGISNKGIFNRASKEVPEQQGIKIDIDSGMVNCILPDGNICNLTDDIKKLKCSCPSRSICKHVIMSLIYIRNNKGILLSVPGASDSGLPEHEDSRECGTEMEEPVKQKFEQLLSISPLQLLELGGEKAYNEALFRINFGIAHEIHEGTMLSVKFINDGVTVRFPRLESVRDVMCSCKKTEFCRHKVEAVILYQLYNDKKDLLEFEENFSVEKPEEVMPEIKKFVGELFISGLSRLPETCLETMEQMSVICHCNGLPAFEKLFRSVKNEAGLYFSKNVGFSREKMRNILMAIYNMCIAVQNAENNSSYLKELIGEYKSSYYDIPPVELCGMGAESWASDSGFEGITYYFYHEKSGKWFTYSNVRPVYYEDIKVNTSRMYKAAPPWGIEGNAEVFSKSVIRLVNGKANREGRLSSSEESQAAITARTDINKINFEGYIYNDWAELFKSFKPDFEYSMTGKKENCTLVILCVHNWGKYNFDSVNQSFSVELYDEKSRKLIINLKYSGKNKYTVEKLEQLLNIEDLPEKVLGSLYLSEGQLRVRPITAWLKGGRSCNLTLE
jgi:hypothetical protein